MGAKNSNKATGSFGTTGRCGSCMWGSSALRCGFQEGSRAQVCPSHRFLSEKKNVFWLVAVSETCTFNSSLVSFAWMWKALGQLGLMTNSSCALGSPALWHFSAWAFNPPCASTSAEVGVTRVAFCTESRKLQADV